MEFSLLEIYFCPRAFYTQNLVMGNLLVITTTDGEIFLCKAESQTDLQNLESLGFMSKKNNGLPHDLSIDHPLSHSFLFP